MQFQVPQFIEVEDKIVGPFSFQQAMYIGIAAGISAALYFTVQTWLWIALSVFIVGGGLSLALLKVNGQRLPKVLRYIFRFYWQPQQYLWQSTEPQLKKTEESLRQTGAAFYLEKILSGMALKHAWQQVQTGDATQSQEDPKPQSDKERYQIFYGRTGERKVAKRIDYR